MNIILSKLLYHLLVITFLVGMMAGAVSQEAFIEVSIKQSTEHKNSIVIEFENLSSEDLYIPYWDSARGELTKDLFRINSDTSEAKYVGKLVKRSDVKPEELVKIGAKSKVSEHVQLGDSYLLKEVYTVKFVSWITMFRVSNDDIEQVSFQKICSNELAFSA